MIVNKKDISVSDAVHFADNDSLLLKRRSNGFLLSDYQVSVLERFGISYRNSRDIRELLLEIECCLRDTFDEELDLVASQIDEYIYYKEFKK